MGEIDFGEGKENVYALEGATVLRQKRSGVQLAVLPCLAAARSGARLGHGGGYYDRFLANYSGRRLILCPEALLAQSLPTGPLDEPAQAVLTEKALYGTL